MRTRRVVVLCLLGMFVAPRPADGLQSMELPARAAPYVEWVIQAASANGLDPAIFAALVWTESGFNENALSSAGAYGLTQLMPGTADGLGVDRYDPIQNLAGGARYLSQQLATFNGDIALALAAYNAGPGAVVASGGIPQNGETPAYVAAVLARAAGLGADLAAGVGTAFLDLSGAVTDEEVAQAVAVLAERQAAADASVVMQQESEAAVFGALTSLVALQEELDALNAERIGHLESSASLVRALYMAGPGLRLSVLAHAEDFAAVRSATDAIEAVVGQANAAVAALGAIDDQLESTRDELDVRLADTQRAEEVATLAANRAADLRLDAEQAELALRTLQGDQAATVERILEERRLAWTEALDGTFDGFPADYLGEAACPVQGFASFVDDFGKTRPYGASTGNDVYADAGTPALAMLAATVADAADDPAHGLTIVLEAGDVQISYTHLAQLAPEVAAGTAVTAGQVLGFVGNTGSAAAASPPHVTISITPAGEQARSPYRVLFMACR